MPSTRVETQVTWSAAASITLATSAAVTSDAMAFSAEDWDVDLQVTADNSGTPASGDIVSVWVAWSSGDILGDSGDDYDTTEHAEFLGTLNTFATDTPGEDPARKTWHIASASKGCKVIVSTPNAATRSIVVRARLIAHRPQ